MLRNVSAAEPDESTPRYGITPFAFGGKVNIAFGRDVPDETREALFEKMKPGFEDILAGGVMLDKNGMLSVAYVVEKTMRALVQTGELHRDLDGNWKLS